MQVLLCKGKLHLGFKENSMIRNNVMIIAEVGNAHEGNLQRAKDLINASADAGVDAIKFQLFTADELLVKSHSKYSHFKGLQMSFEGWKVLCGLSKERGLKFFCDVFGTDSYKTCKKLKADGIKIHGSDISNNQLLNAVSEWDKDIFLSCGGATELEIHRALKILKSFDSNKKIILMHGFQNFPTSKEETNLSRLKTLAYKFLQPVGFMDHINAENELSQILPLLALAAGACVIEKHITMDRSLKGIDYYSSLEPEEMASLVERIRDVKTILGRSEIVFGKEESIYRKKMKKHLVALYPVQKGQIITDRDMAYKRAECSAYPANYEEVIGKKTNDSFSADEPILYSKLDMKVGILVIARLNSRRLQEKAILPIMGSPVLSYLIERAKLCKNAHEVILCTGSESRNGPLVEIAKREGIKYYCGDEEDVVSRMCGACEREKLDVAVRVTGDDILFSYEYGDFAIEHLLKNNADYCHNKGLISGSECEVFLYRTLKTIYNFAEDRGNTEYLTYYVENENFQKTELEIPDDLRRNISVTLDTPGDFKKVKFLLEHIYRKETPFTQKELTSFVDKHPEIFRESEKGAGSPVRDTVNYRLNFSIR